jgi:hypothetical protein
VRLLGKPRPRGLLGGEEALLGLGYFVEPSSGFFIRSWHCIFPQLSWGIMRYRQGRKQEPLAITLLLQDLTGTPGIQPEA